MRKITVDKDFEKALENAVESLDDRFIREAAEIKYAFYQNNSGTLSVRYAGAAYKKKLALVAAVLALGAVLVAVPLAVNNSGDSPAPVIPTAPTASPAVSAVIPPVQTSDTMAETTLPGTTAKKVKIIYADKSSIVKEEINFCNGSIYMENYLLRNRILVEKMEQEEDENALFYVMLDTKFGGLKFDIGAPLWEEFKKGKENLTDAELEYEYQKVFKNIESGLLLPMLSENGISFEYQIEGYYLGYIKKSDYEKMNEIVGGDLYLLPEDFSFEKWYTQYRNKMAEGKGGNDEIVGWAKAYNS